MAQLEKHEVLWDISWKSIVKIVGTIAAVYLLLQLQSVIVSLFISIILMSAISPLVTFINRRTRLSLRASITIAYLVTFSLIGTVLFIVVPPLVKQLGIFIIDLPRYTSAAINSIGLFQADGQVEAYTNNVIALLNEKSGEFAAGALNITLSLFSSLLDSISIAVFTFYLLLEKKEMESSLFKQIPFLSSKKRTDFENIFRAIEVKLGHWSRGQFLLCIIVGLLTYIGLLLLQVQYALPLAVIAGILEIVPIIGPIISAVPALIVILALDPTKTPFILALYILVQQLENNLIVPQVMKKAVGISPLITILALMIGGTVMGTSGALLAIPVAVTLVVVYEYYKQKQA